MFPYMFRLKISHLQGDLITKENRMSINMKYILSLNVKCVFYVNRCPDFLCN